MRLPVSGLLTLSSLETMTDSNDISEKNKNTATWIGLSRGFSTPAGERQSLVNESVFHVDEETFRSSLPQVTHWSIAWSDLMMTMFIVFLSLFVYQAAHRQFLVSDEIEVIGGDTAPALEAQSAQGPSAPFVPITAGAPLITAGFIKKIEPIRIDAIAEDAAFFDEASRGGRQRLEQRLAAVSSSRHSMASDEALPHTAAPPATAPIAVASKSHLVASPTGRPRDLRADKAMLDRALSSGMATVDLPEQGTMRITLTSDRIFSGDTAVDLSPAAGGTLRAIGAVIWDIPYQVSVIGHTDDRTVPPRYETDWELSAAQAARVARYLIEEVGMDPQQFTVIGYGSQRPAVANHDEDHRSINRRIELVVSTRPQPPIVAALSSTR